MIYGKSENITDELESHTLHDEVRDKFYVNPNDIFYPHDLTIGNAPEVVSESLEILRETPQLSEDHLAETNISIENNHENQSDTSTAIQEAGTSEGSPGIPVVENDDNEVHPSSDNLGFEIIELPNENIEDIPDIQPHRPEIHLDHNLDIQLNIPFIPLDTTDVQLHMMYTLFDTQNILFQPPEPPNYYMFETSIDLPPLPLIINGPNIQLQQQVAAPMEIDVQQSIAEVVNEN